MTLVLAILIDLLILLIVLVKNAQFIQMENSVEVLLQIQEEQLVHVDVMESVFVVPVFGVLTAVVFPVEDTTMKFVVELVLANVMETAHAMMDTDLLPSLSKFVNVQRLVLLLLSMIALVTVHVSVVHAIVMTDGHYFLTVHVPQAVQMIVMELDFVAVMENVSVILVSLVILVRDKKFVKEIHAQIVQALLDVLGVLSIQFVTTQIQ
jgi:hypothetical protein